MFTGLVQDVGTIEELQATADGMRLTVTARVVRELNEGDSVAVNGVCLTAAAVGDRSFTAEAVNETLRRTTLGSLERGAAVNLELPLRASDRLGGHFVQGHVDGVGEVVEVRDDGFSRWIAIAARPDLLRYVVEKGSIAVDGVSLTVAEVGERSFAVALIPETIDRSNLGGAERGRKLNLEVDVLAKYVEKAARSR